MRLARGAAAGTAGGVVAGGPSSRRGRAKPVPAWRTTTDGVAKRGGGTVKKLTRRQFLIGAAGTAGYLGLSGAFPRLAFGSPDLGTPSGVWGGSEPGHCHDSCATAAPSRRPRRDARPRSASSAAGSPASPRRTACGTPTSCCSSTSAAPAGTRRGVAGGTSTTPSARPTSWSPRTRSTSSTRS